jgi:hypothetical protein
MALIQDTVEQAGQKSILGQATKSQGKKWFVYSFFGMYLLLGLFIYGDYGVSTDEAISRMNGMVSAKYILSIVKPEAKNKYGLAMVKDLHAYTDKDYGVAFELPVFVLEKVLGIGERDPALFRMRHLCTFLVFFAGVVYFYRLARHRFGSWKWGLLGSFFLIVSPRIFAESFYNDKDVVLLACFIISTFYLIRFLEKKSMRSALLLAVASALTVNIRIPGVLIVLVAFGFVVWEIILPQSRREALRRTLPAFAFFLILCAFFTVLFWPYLWKTPVGNFRQAFLNMSHFRWESFVLYRGKLISATQLPWHYIPVWVVITTPLLYLVLFGLGLVSVIRQVAGSGWRLYRNGRQRQDLVFLALSAGPVAAVILFGSVLYDGWRQLYFIYGSFLMLALAGLYNLRNWFSASRTESAKSRLDRVGAGLILICLSGTVFS